MQNEKWNETTWTFKKCCDLKYKQAKSVDMSLRARWSGDGSVRTHLANKFLRLENACWKVKAPDAKIHKHHKIPTNCFKKKWISKSLPAHCTHRIYAPSYNRRIISHQQYQIQHFNASNAICPFSVPLNFRQWIWRFYECCMNFEMGTQNVGNIFTKHIDYISSSDAHREQTLKTKIDSPNIHDWQLVQILRM